ncbi:MAG: hypothetical protein R2761_23550 [Acidimicrobiales bacterium]
MTSALIAVGFFRLVTVDRPGQRLLAVGSVGVAAGGIHLASFATGKRKACGWGPAHLTVPLDGLQLGSRRAVVYRRSRPPGTDGSTNGELTVALLCEETFGNAGWPIARVVARRTVATPVTTGAAGVEVRFTLEIPVDVGTPTMWIRSFRDIRSVEWRIEAALHGPGLPTDTTWFPVDVLPILDPAWAATVANAGTNNPAAPVVPPPPGLSFALDHWLAELGGAFQGTVTYRPPDGSTTRIEGIRLELVRSAVGIDRPTIRTLVSQQRWTVEPGMPLIAPFVLDVPRQEAISYAGRMIGVRWVIEATITGGRQRETATTAEVAVIPVGAGALYSGPHPYRPPRP